jgi:hypothetical protein
MFSSHITLSSMFGTSAAVFSVLLVLTGLAKLRRPTHTSRALAALGLPDHRLVGLMIGVVEIGVGVGALLTVNRLWLLVQAALYAAFTVWIGIALARDLPIASCGCLGTDDTPPYWGHLLLDLTAVLVSVGAAFTLAAPLLGETDLEIAASLVLIGVGGYLAWLTIGEAARLRGTYSA